MRGWWAPVLVWAAVCPREGVLPCVLYTALFAAGEAAWYRAWYGYWFTSLEQAVGNLCLGVPLLVLAWPRLVPWLVPRVLLFPVGVWAFELVLGTCLVWMYGCNRAWTYSHGRHACISCAPRWLGVGVFLEILRDTSVFS